MGKHSGKLKQTATYVASKLYSDKKISELARTGERNGETMAEIFNKIQSANNIRREEVGNKTNLYMKNEKGEESQVGWYETRGGAIGMGWFDDKAYEKLTFDEDYSFDRELPGVEEEESDDDFDYDDIYS